MTSVRVKTTLLSLVSVVSKNWAQHILKWFVCHHMGENLKFFFLTLIEEVFKVSYGCHDEAKVTEVGSNGCIVGVIQNLVKLVDRNIVSENVSKFVQ